MLCPDMLRNSWYLWFCMLDNTLMFTSLTNIHLGTCFARYTIYVWPFDFGRDGFRSLTCTCCRSVRKTSDMWDSYWWFLLRRMEGGFTIYLVNETLGIISSQYLANHFAWLSNLAQISSCTFHKPSESVHSIPTFRNYTISRCEFHSLLHFCTGVQGPQFSWQSCRFQCLSWSQQLKDTSTSKMNTFSGLPCYRAGKKLFCCDSDYKMSRDVYMFVYNVLMSLLVVHWQQETLLKINESVQYTCMKGVKGINTRISATLWRYVTKESFVQDFGPYISPWTTMHVHVYIIKHIPISQKSHSTSLSFL